MTTKRIKLRSRHQRPVLTDMLPFEVPPTFSNRGFYAFLRRHKVEIASKRVSWINTEKNADEAIRLLFSVPLAAVPAATVEQQTSWGATRSVSSYPLGQNKPPAGKHLKWVVPWTIPFSFQVAHKDGSRVLSVVHPRNQILVSEFYNTFASTISAYSSLSEFSIRRPVRVSKYSYYNDKMHSAIKSHEEGVEEVDHEYEQMGSFFVYDKYNNIHKFFESYKYHASEKKYRSMARIDLSRCFDSIYTHSISWCVFGKKQAKFSLDETNGTFAGQFDKLMQAMNHGETNGIVIGPEFSRIFAEIILQSIDKQLVHNLASKANLHHRVDYEIFRYVDDYFLFFNEDKDRAVIFNELASLLNQQKLGINESKTKVYEKPIITEMTIAKEKISVVLNEYVRVPKDDAELEKPSGVIGSSGSVTVPIASPTMTPVPTVPPAETKFSCKINANRLILNFKTAVFESKVSYDEISNYTFAIIENKHIEIFRYFDKMPRSFDDQKRLVSALSRLAEFAFFVYSANPRVNLTVRLCRSIASSTDFLKARQFPFDLKHLYYKYVHDNIVQQLGRHRVDKYREIEVHYLLIALAELGRGYWLPEEVLASHFSIETKNGQFARDTYLNHFSITVLLFYMKDKKRYDKLRKFLISHVVEKMNFMTVYCPNETESVLLILDLLTCPYVSDAEKLQLGSAVKLSNAQTVALKDTSQQWFTAWGKGFKLSKELDGKRSREVY